MIANNVEPRAGRLTRGIVQFASVALLLVGVAAGCSSYQSMTGSSDALTSAEAPAAAPPEPFMGDADVAALSAPEGAVVVRPDVDARSRAQQNQLVAATPLPADIGQSGPSSGTASRHIIKNAEMVLEVEGVERAVGRVETAAAQAGGYVLETRSDYAADGVPMAVVSVAVPEEQFETARDRIRAIGMRVISEHASGVDVSQEYVDLDSEIANLEATQARIRGFLEQATNVEEALQVNARLTEIEGQISQRKGRLGYLAQRSAFSTLAIELRQVPLSVTPTPTATRTPRPPWSPADTADDAFATLSGVVRGLGTLAIWLVIVAGPFALPFLAIYWLLKRRGGKARNE